MDKYKIIIVDDEPPARMKLINFIEKIPQLDLKGDFADPFDALNYLNNNHDCIVLLDINMEGMNGFELIENLKSQPNIIITSAHEEYALKGFEFNVTDYLLKPFSFDRFWKSIAMAIFNINLTNKQLGRNSEKEQYLSMRSK